MIAVDTNILVYANRGEYPFHQAAQAAIGELAASGRRWAVPWPCVHEFIAIVTNTRIHRPATTVAMAMTFINNIRAVSSCEFIGEGEGYFEIFRDLAAASHVCGGQIHDCRIAAIAIHHGASELWTADRDFSRFPRLKTRNPLIKK